MAVTTWSSKAALAKAVLLPFTLVLLAMAAGASSSTEDRVAVAESGGRSSSTEAGVAVAESGGRSSTATPVGRKLLNFNFCGSGTAPTFSCPVFLPFAFNATCCTDIFGNQVCYDVGGYLPTKCGSCTTSCTIGQVCCKGVCANLLTDKNNCGLCGRKCNGPCTFGFCNY